MPTIPDRHAGDLTAEFPSRHPVVTERPGPPEEASIDPDVAAAEVIPRGGATARHGGAANGPEADPEVSAGLVTHRTGSTEAAGPAWSVPSGAGQPQDRGAPGGEAWRAAVGARPGWHAVMTPQAVQEAFRAVQDAVLACNDAEVAVIQVAVDQRAAEAAEMAAHRGAARDGTDPPKAAKPHDWEADRRRLTATAHGLLDRAKAARAAYDQAVEKALPDWSAALAAEVRPHHVAAVQALGKAARELDTLISLITIVQNLGAERSEDRVPLPQFGPAREGIDKALNILSRLKTHEPLTESKVRPSRQARLAMAHSGDMHTMWQLQQVEIKEGWKVTDYMRGQLLEKVPGPYSNDA